MSIEQENSVPYDGYSLEHVLLAGPNQGTLPGGFPDDEPREDENYLKHSTSSHVPRPENTGPPGGHRYRNEERMSHAAEDS